MLADQSKKTSPCLQSPSMARSLTWSRQERSDRNGEVSTIYVNAAAPSSMGPGGLARPRPSPVFNQASTYGLNALIMQNLHNIGFLTTEGIAASSTWDASDGLPWPSWIPSWRRSFGDGSRSLAPLSTAPDCRASVRRRQRALPSRRGSSPPPDLGARPLPRRRRRHLPTQRLCNAAPRDSDICSCRRSNPLLRL